MIKEKLDRSEIISNVKIERYPGRLTFASIKSIYDAVAQLSAGSYAKLTNDFRIGYAL